MKAIVIDLHKLVQSEQQQKVFIGEASELGWAPGRWPRFIASADGQKIFGPAEQLSFGFRYPPYRGTDVEIHVLND